MTPELIERIREHSEANRSHWTAPWDGPPLNTLGQQMLDDLRECHSLLAAVLESVPSAPRRAPDDLRPRDI